MDNVFSSNVILRFVLPGLTSLIAFGFLIDGVCFFFYGNSISKQFASINLTWPTLVWIIPYLSFVAGIIINAFMFERSYAFLHAMYRKRNGANIVVEKRVYSLVYESLKISDVNCSAEEGYDEDLLKQSWAGLCRDNRRGISLVLDDAGKIESMREDLATYLDFQIGLAIGFFFLAISFGFWITISKSILLVGIARVPIGLVICCFLVVCAYFLWGGAYKNYRKMRQSRAVMLAALVGKSSALVSNPNSPNEDAGKVASQQNAPLSRGA